jgi:GDPmannose 4,6-dehydratase
MEREWLVRLKALITGVTGQDGSYLAEYLLSKGYEIHAFVRRFETQMNIANIINDIHTYDIDINDLGSIISGLSDIRPDEIYHLASQSYVGASFASPILTGEVTGLGTLRILEACRFVKLDCRIYNAGTSEMYGGGRALNEASPFSPRSPYGAAKLYAYWVCKNYREAYGMYISNGILFNHESPRRGIEFVTRRISNGVARIKLGLSKRLTLGNIKASRDWGYAPDYVEGMHAMLKLDEPDDIVLCTGVPHSVMDFADEAFRIAGVGRASDYVDFDSNRLRPSEIDLLIGDPAKAKRVLGWKAKTKFKELVRIMVDADLALEESRARTDAAKEPS